MRIALISDIHGNLTALEATLADIGERGADAAVCLGDVAPGGPQPRETLERLRGLGWPCVMGNADAWLLDPSPVHGTSAKMQRINEIDLWCAQQLSPGHREYLRTLAPVVDLPAGNGERILCFHGSPRSYDDVILSTTSERDLQGMLAGATATLLAGAHTHVPMLRRYRDALIINPGSVGRPFEVSGSGRERKPPWAEYALVDRDGERLGVEFRRIPVDIDTVSRAARESGMPHAAWWARSWR